MSGAPFTSPQPEPARLLAKAFEQYLERIYGARAPLLPQAQRNELEQAYYASAATMLDLALSTHRNRAKALVQISAEIDAYAATRKAIVSLTGKTLIVRKGE